MRTKRIEMKGVGFRYSEEREKAVQDVDFSIGRGEVVFVSGSSGSGKSTLLNIINGIIPEVVEGELEGEVWIGGKKDLRIHERSSVLGNVFQNPRSQFFTTNSTAELVFEMENYGFTYEEMDRRLQSIIRDFRAENLLNREIFRISSGERQFLALLSTLIIDPEVVIFDEPSANLDYGNAMRLKKQIEKLKSQGKTVLVADHRCFYLRGVIDRVLLVEENTVKELGSEKEFMEYDYGKRVFDLFEHEFPKREIAASGQAGVQVCGLHYGDILKDVTLRFNRHEVSTIIGINGAGKTTLAKLISKVLKPDKGEVRGEEQPLYIMQDADFQLFGASCLKELEITEKEEEKNYEALKKLNLWELRDKHPQTLSGGEKQRLQMAIALVSPNEVVILDEPTSGLDKNSMRRVIEMLELLKESKTIIVISHDYEFIRNCSDKIIYIKDAKVADEFYLEDCNIGRLNQIYREMENSYE
ncbi:MAG: ABC transporter ATP-binding protein [Peptostreptococcaceae bacterium]|nr:ABC transporter ATP-binding protein [Peptostreptococcaceae bacterium]